MRHRAGATTLYIPQAHAYGTHQQPTYLPVHTALHAPSSNAMHAPSAPSAYAGYAGAGPVASSAHAMPTPLAPMPSMGHVAPMSLDQIPGHVVFGDVHGAPSTSPVQAHLGSYAPMQASPRAPIVLEGRYPQLGAALGTWLQVEPDEVERIRIARDLGTLGGAGSARALLDGVRTGVLSPTIASDQLERGGFEAGITVAAALRDPEPRVRALATSLVGRTTPLEPARMTQPHVPPMPNPPHPPHQPDDPSDPRG